LKQFTSVEHSQNTTEDLTALFVNFNVAEDATGFPCIILTHTHNEQHDVYLTSKLCLTSNIFIVTCTAYCQLLTLASVKCQHHFLCDQ